MNMASSTADSAAAATAPHNGFSLISNEKLLELYTTMLKCRSLQKHFQSAANQKEKNGPDAAIQSEAPVAGLCLDLLPGDTLAAGPRGYSASFVKGLPLQNIFATLAPAGRKPTFRYATINLVPPSLRLDAQLERVLTAAKENKARRNKKLVVAFCGDPRTTSNLFPEVISQAAKRKLPMLLVCDSAPDAEDLCLMAKEFEVSCMTVDGADAVAVYRAATEAITHARRGSGPTLIECKPWVCPGQKAAELRKAADSIFRMEGYLTRKGLFDKKLKSSVTAQFRKEISAALLFKDLA